MQKWEYRTHRIEMKNGGWKAIMYSIRKAKRVINNRIIFLTIFLLTIACTSTQQIDVTPMVEDQITELQATINAQATQLFEISSDISTPVVSTLVPTATNAIATEVETLSSVSTLVSEIATPTAVAEGIIEPESMQTSEPSILPCQVDRWELIPIGIYEFLVPDGWKIVVIRFAVHNGSDLWGDFELKTHPNFGNTILETEDGYVYELHRATSNSVYLPDDPRDTPYSGAIHVPNQINTNVYVPPGFTVTGNLGGASNALSHPHPVIDSLYQLLFKVPQAQQEYTLTLPGGVIRCIDEYGSKVTGLWPVRPLNVSTSIQPLSYPTEREDIPAFTTVNIEDGLFTLDRISFSDFKGNDAINEEMDIFFKVENTHGGSDFEGSISPTYLIGDDGIIRYSGCRQLVGCTGVDNNGGSYRIGPSQSGEAAIAYLIEPIVSSWHLVWLDEDRNFYETFRLDVSSQ